MVKAYARAALSAIATLMTVALAAAPDTKHAHGLPVSFNGVGFMKIGVTSRRLEQMARAGLMVQNDKTIRDKDIPTAACVDVRFFRNYELLGAQIVAGSVVRLDIIANSASATEEGVHLGATEKEVRRAYAGRFVEGTLNRLTVNSYHGDSGHAFLIKSPDGTRAILIEADEGGAVLGIHVGSIDVFRIDKDGSIWAPPCDFRDLQPKHYLKSHAPH